MSIIHIAILKKNGGVFLFYRDNNKGKNVMSIAYIKIFHTQANPYPSQIIPKSLRRYKMPKLFMKPASS